MADNLVGHFKRPRDNQVITIYHRKNESAEDAKVRVTKRHGASPSDVKPGPPPKSTP